MALTAGARVVADGVEIGGPFDPQAATSKPTATVAAT